MSEAPSRYPGKANFFMSGNHTTDDIDDMREEYDFANMAGGVQGKYAKELSGNVKITVLDSDLAKILPDSVSVNEALRTLVRVLGHEKHFAQQMTDAYARHGSLR